MSKSELIVGLDIGTTKICAVVGEPSDNGTIEIVGIGTSPSTGLRKGVVVNIEQTVQSIRKAVEEAEGFAESGLEIIETANLPAAVAAAQGAAVSGDVVVLSPACAAFDQFKNFMERGKVFKELVNAL